MDSQRATWTNSKIVPRPLLMYWYSLRGRLTEEEAATHDMTSAQQQVGKDTWILKSRQSPVSTGRPNYNSLISRSLASLTLWEVRENLVIRLTDLENQLHQYQSIMWEEQKQYGVWMKQWITCDNSSIDKSRACIYDRSWSWDIPTCVLFAHPLLCWMQCSDTWSN